MCSVSMLTLNDLVCQAFWLLTMEIFVVLSANNTNTVSHVKHILSQMMYLKQK